MADKSKLGLVQVFYGNGKGKTTAALGIALRACGNGFSVHIVQFMKNGASTLNQQIPGEIKALEKFSNFSFKRFGIGDWYVKGKNDDIHKKNVEEAFDYLANVIKNTDYDVLIADEILYAVQFGLLDKNKVIALIKEKPKNKELILTGSHKPLQEIFDVADLVTEVKKIKHPYDKGVLARQGLDY